MGWFGRFCRVIGRPEWIIDQRMTSNLNNPDVIGAEVEAAFLDWLKPRTRQQAMAEAQAAGWPLSALNTPADVMRDPHMRERGFFATVEHPQASPVVLPGLALRFSGTPGELRRRRCWESTTSRCSADWLHAAGSGRAARAERDLDARTY